MILDLAHIFVRRLGAAVRAAEEPILNEPAPAFARKGEGEDGSQFVEETNGHMASMYSWCLRRSRAAKEKWWWGRRTPLSLMFGQPWLTPEPLAGLEIVRCRRPRHPTTRNLVALDPAGGGP